MLQVGEAMAKEHSMKLVAETNTGHLRSFVKHHVTHAFDQPLHWCNCFAFRRAGWDSSQSCQPPEAPVHLGSAHSECSVRSRASADGSAGGAFTTILSGTASMSASSKSLRRLSIMRLLSSPPVFNFESTCRELQEQVTQGEW